jgi:proteasome alpha subunit
VTDEPGFVAFGGQAEQVSAELKERYSDGMSLSEAFAAALAALSTPGNGERTEFTASQLEVAVLERARDHRTFRRIRAARLEELIAGARPAAAETAPPDEPGPPGPPGPSGSSAPADTGPPTGPDPSSSDRGTGLDGGTPPRPL